MDRLPVVCLKGLESPLASTRATYALTVVTTISRHSQSSKFQNAEVKGIVRDLITPLNNGFF